MSNSEIPQGSDSDVSTATPSGAPSDEQLCVLLALSGTSWNSPLTQIVICELEKRGHSIRYSAFDGISCLARHRCSI